MKLWHASRAATAIERFRAFSHFGSLEAALDRSQSAVFREAPTRLYEVELTVRTPLRVTDISDAVRSNNHSLIRWVDFLHYDVRKISSAERDSVFKASGPRLTDEERGFVLLAGLLRQKGYDGIVYENDWEAPGQDSWVILDPEHAKISRSISAAEAAALTQKG